MIIHQTEKISHGEFTTIWAKVELEKIAENFPEYLWYRVPSQYSEFLSLQGDAFLMPGLMAAMYFGEDIQVRSPISPRLAYHLEEFQHVLSFRFPKYLRKIKIKYDQIKPVDTVPIGIGSTFTGGVDSTFTLWKNIPKNQHAPEYQITHCVFVKGFDILHREKQDYMQLFNQFKPQLAKLGVDLIPLETNIVGVAHLRLPLSFLFGPLIVSVGLSLDRLFHRFFIPSSWDYHILAEKAYASDPLIDGLLSTDTMNIIHHGATHRRVEKLEEIANWELAQKLLWVCIDSKFETDTWNCSRCEKCTRTMIPLFALGKMEKFKTFTKPFKTNRDSLWWIRKFSLHHAFDKELFPFVKKHKKELLPWLRTAALFGHVRFGLVKYLPGFIKNWLRQFGYFVLRNEHVNAYEMTEVTQLIRGQNDHTST